VAGLCSKRLTPLDRSRAIEPDSGAAPSGDRSKNEHHR
jgi:hypothetical protein